MSIFNLVLIALWAGILVWAIVLLVSGAYTVIFIPIFMIALSVLFLIKDIRELVEDLRDGE